MDADEDAYGRAIRDYYEGGESLEIVERDDGFVEGASGPGDLLQRVRRLE